MNLSKKFSKKSKLETGDVKSSEPKTTIHQKTSNNTENKNEGSKATVTQSAAGHISSGKKIDFSKVTRNKKKIAIGVLGIAVLVGCVLAFVVYNNRTRTVPEDITASLQEATCDDTQLAKLIKLVEENNSVKPSAQKAETTQALANCYILRGEYAKASEVMNKVSSDYEQAGLTDQQNSAKQTADTLNQAANTPANPEPTPEGIPDIDNESVFAN